MSLRKRSGKQHLPQDAVSEKPKAVGEREIDPGIRPSHAASSLVDYSFILSLVLGGCCAYVLLVYDDGYCERSYRWRAVMSGHTNNC